MAKLTSSIKRDNNYSQGGVAAIIAFRTFRDNGVLSSAAYTKDVDGKVTAISLYAGDATTGAGKIVPVALESDVDKAGATHGLVIGASRYIKQGVSFVLGGSDGVKNKMLEDVDLVPHTFVVKDKRGNCFVYGELSGLVSEKNDGALGTAPGDLNGYDIVVSGTSNGRPALLTAAAWDSLAALVTV